MSGRSTPSRPTVTISDYILRRLSEIGSKDIFGVRGDFNLRSLDFVEDYPKLHWIGTSNELNGAYAADGYSRIHGAAAFVTTYGVGELSALNAFAGAYAEQVPIIHIVGGPSTSQQNSRLILHHTLGTPVFDVFLKAASSCMAASLAIDSFTTGSEIDQVIETCLHRNLPVYILLPQDLVDRRISSEPLSRPLDIHVNGNDEESTGNVLAEILRVLKGAERPAILADAGASRDNVLEEVHQLCRVCKDWPVYVSAMGKGSVNEQLPNFAGTYVGKLSHPSVPEYLEKADCVISIGRFTSDFNTGFSTMVREGVSATLFLFNNKGYTIEKYIHGVKREYNNINSKWDYAKTLSYFGDEKGLQNTYSVRTEEELEKVLAELSESQGEGLKFVVVGFAPMDSPRMLRRVAELNGRVKENGEIYDL